MMRIPKLAVLISLTAVAVPPAAAQQVLYDMLVSSRNTNSVKRFDGATGEFVDDFIGPEAGGLRTTQEILLAPNGDLIVSGLGNQQILSYDYRTGGSKGAFTSGYSLREPTKMTWGPDGNLYVSQWGDSRHTVAVFGSNGAFIREATPSIPDPMQHAWDTDGSLLVVYWGTKDVRRFDADGNQLEIFISDSRLEGPVNLRWDDDQNLHVFDWQSGAVYRYNGQDGSYLDTFIPSLRSPEGWAIGPDGNLYVAEWTGNAVKRFDAETGALLDVFAQGNGLDAPNSVLFVERPSVFELQASGGEIQITPGASMTVSVDVVGSRDVPFESAVDLECTPAATVIQCSVDPTSVTPGVDGATAAVMITAATSQQTVAPIWGLVTAVFFAVAVAGGSRRRLAFGIALVLVVSCGDETGPDMNETIDTSVRITGRSEGLTDVVTVRVTEG